DVGCELARAPIEGACEEAACPQPPPILQTWVRRPMPRPTTYPTAPAPGGSPASDAATAVHLDASARHKLRGRIREKQRRIRDIRGPAEPAQGDRCQYSGPRLGCIVLAD